MTIRPTRTVISNLDITPKAADPRWPIALTFSDKYDYDKTTHSANANPTFDFLARNNMTSRAGFIQSDVDATVKLNSTANESINLDAGRPMVWDDFYVSKVYITNTASATIELFATG